MSSSALRGVVLACGAASAGGALFLAFANCYPAAGLLALGAALLFLGLLIERWRYKPLAGPRPGPDWQATGERFVDPETGKLVAVYFQPATGERRYIAV
jgi:hypothetical protein